MEVRCHHCGQAQAVGDNIFGNREKAEVTCSACGKRFQVINPHLATLRSETTRRVVPSITSEVSADGRMLRLPPSHEISLKVIEGKETGTVYPVNKPRVTIGRTNADVIVNDKMSSRLHCALEISDEWVLLRDLGSTNGTLVNDQPIQTATLKDGSTFRIGSHAFQLVIAPKGK